MTKVADNPDLAQRRAKSSDEYVGEIMQAQNRLKKATGRTKATSEEKKNRLKTILADRENYMQRLGQGMVGTIQLKLRYQGITRNILMEDPLTPGVPTEYDVLDDLGQAYILHGSEGEVRVTPFEGKRVPVRPFRIAAFPQVKKEDLWFLRVNAVEYAQDESKQAIMKQEDARLVTLLESAIEDYGNHPHNPHGGPTKQNELSGYFTPESLYDLAGVIDGRELAVTKLVMHPTDYRDLYKWDLSEVGWSFKDRVVAGETITEFGEFQIIRSVQVPPGTMFLTPDPNFLGVFPVMYSLDVEENHSPEKFHRGWVMDELVSMLILNPRGLGQINKSG